MLAKCVLLWFGSMAVGCLAYTIPKPTVEPLTPSGFRVSIPDETGIRLFAFHGKKNVRFNNDTEAGTVRGDARAPTNGRWTYTNNNMQLAAGDVLYYWVYVQFGGLAYRLYDQQFRLEGSGGGSSVFDDDIDVREVPMLVATPSTPVAKPEKLCNTTVTSVNGGQKNVCGGELIFEDNFHGLAQWKAEIRIPNDEKNAEFVSYQFNTDVVKTANNQLEIRPRLWNETEHADESNSVLDLRSKCTAPTPAECYREAFGFRIVPPVVTAKLNTRSTFSFRYGRIEIRAKLPRGDWIFPHMLLEPQQSESPRLSLASVRGNELLRSADGAEIGGRVLQAGVEIGSSECSRNFAEHVGQEFHVFGLMWSDSLMLLSVDGETYCEISDVQVAGEYYLSLGVGVGGISTFPDGSTNGLARRRKPWRNDDPKAELNFWSDVRQWWPTWTTVDSALTVDYVRVYAL